MDRYELYELCTQTPERDVLLLRAMHGARPKVLGEDFAGTAALSRAWVRRVPAGSAIAVDRDPEPLARVGEGRGASGVPNAQKAPKIHVRCADVLRERRKVDLLVALNFSLCEWHDRRDLVRYLAHARRRLRPGGLFVADLYGGEGAFTPGELEESHRGPQGERVTYAFEQRTADALTGRVVDALHFKVRELPRRGLTRRRGRKVLRDAFVYDWRLWSVPELRDALVDAGFGQTAVYSRFEHAVDARGRVHVRPISSSAELGGSFCVFVAARQRVA